MSVILKNVGIDGRVINQSIVGPSDPYFSDVTLLANASTSAVIDQSSYGVTLTNGTGITLDDAIFKFAGTKSIKFVSSSTGISVPYTAAKFDMVDTNTVWTVESWVYLQGNQSSIQTYRLDIVGNSASNKGWETAITSSTMTVIYPGFGGPIPSAIPIASSAWHHLIWMRNGTNYSYGKNGTIVATATYTGGNDPDFFLNIGGNYLDNVGITYNLQDVRITKNILRYPTTLNSTYTVPTAPFPTY